MLSFHYSGEDSQQNCFSAAFVGKRNDWTFYADGGEIGDTELFGVQGNHCTNIVSKIVAFVSSFFGYGKIIQAKLPNAKGRMESQIFWAKRKPAIPSYLQSDLQTSSILWMFHKFAYKEA